MPQSDICQQRIFGEERLQLYGGNSNKASDLTQVAVCDSELTGIRKFK